MAPLSSSAGYQPDDLLPRDILSHTVRACDPEKAGVNRSKVHFDFMIGTADLSVTGIVKDGREIPVMRDGVFVL